MFSGWQFKHKLTKRKKRIIFCFGCCIACLTFNPSCNLSRGKRTIPYQLPGWDSADEPETERVLAWKRVLQSQGGQMVALRLEPHHFKWNHAKETTAFPQRNAVKKNNAEAGCTFFPAEFMKAFHTTIRMQTKSLSIQKLICTKNKAFLLPDLWVLSLILCYYGIHIQLHKLLAAPGCRMAEVSQTRQKLSLLPSDFQLHLIQSLFTQPFHTLTFFPPQHRGKIYILQVN